MRPRVASRRRGANPGPGFRHRPFPTLRRGADRPAARYAEQATLRRGDRVALLAFPDVELEVGEVLPFDPPAG